MFLSFDMLCLTHKISDRLNYWFLKAAEQGDLEARFNLGLNYAKGKGVPRDNIAAYMWIFLAVEEADSSSDIGKLVSQHGTLILQDLSRRMSVAEIAQSKHAIQAAHS